MVLAGRAQRLAAVVRRVGACWIWPWNLVRLFYLALDVAIAVGSERGPLDRAGELPLPAPRKRLVGGLHRGIIGALALGCIFAGYKQFTGEQALTPTRLLIHDQPLLALQSNLEAYKANPWGFQQRLNMMLTLHAVLLLPRNNPGIEIRLSQSAAERAFAIGSSASPHHAFTLLIRLDHLINMGRWEEAERIADELRLDHSRRPEVREVLRAWELLRSSQ